MTVFAIFILVIETAFALVVFMAGLDLVKIKSFQKTLTKYEKQEKSRTFIQDWFFGWRFSWERHVHRSMIHSMGDKRVTRFFNASGIFFIIAAVLLIITIVVQYRALTFIAY
jgi:hypothetical protein